LPDVICALLQLYWYVIIGRVIFSWIPTTPGGAAAQIDEVLRLLTEPLLGPLRRLIGPVRVGAMGLDLSPMIVLIAWWLAMRAIGC
jgi:YggT family protein